MTSAFQTQLRAIAAKSSHELDIRARRSAYAESLIFEREVAVKQDWETIYQICQEGFQELCALDPRLSEYDRNLFSPHSTSQDRDQLNKAENAALDTVIARCIRALGKWVGVKPGVKSMEWLVRRFRVHVYNVDVLLATFLPYHEQPVWRNALRLVQEGSEGRPLAPEWKFLGPYLELASKIPRHAIVYSMTSNDGLFRTMNSYVLAAGQEESTWPQLMRFWSSVVVEAVVGRLDQAKSGRKDLQTQKLEDTLFKILPVLEEGFQTRNCPEMTVACYTVAMVLAGTVELPDAVLDGIMDRASATLAYGELDPKNALVCLAVLATKKQEFGMSRKVLSAVMNTSDLETILTDIAKKYPIQHLITALLRTSRDGIRKQNYSKNIIWIGRLLRAGCQSCPTPIVAHWLQELFQYSQTLDASNAVQSATKAHLVYSLQRLEGLDEFRSAFIELSNIAGDAFNAYEAIIGSAVQAIEPVAEDVFDVMDVDQEDVSANGTPKLYPADVDNQLLGVTSFLQPSTDSLFDTFSKVFEECCGEPEWEQEFADMGGWQAGSNSPLLFVSFHVRMACGRSNSKMRHTALTTLLDTVESFPMTDFQALIPYMLICLADNNRAVRRVAADVLAATSDKPLRVVVEGEDFQQLGKDGLYDPENASKVHWMPTTQMRKILVEVIMPALEECVLDAKRVPSLIEEALTGSTILAVPGTKTASLDIKKGVRQSFFEMLTSHAVATPLLKVKLGVLNLLQSIGKVGHLSKSKELEHVLSFWCFQNEEDAVRIAANTGVSLAEIDTTVMEIVTAQDKEAFDHTLSNAVDGGEWPRKDLVVALFYRISTIWLQMKVDSQRLLIAKLFNLAVSRGSPLASDARHLLEELPLSNALLLAMLDLVHASLSDMQVEGLPRKRRRTSHGRQSLPTDASQVFDDLLPKLTLALELVEHSKPEAHEELLGPLFGILEVIRQLRRQQHFDSPYALNLCLSNILAIVTTSTNKQKPGPDFSALRADMVTDLVRNSENPQVQTTALLLSAAMAQHVPSQMVHNIMPIFTFVGDSIFSKSEEHSINVINQAIDQIIPPLVASLKRQNGANMVISASSLLSSFAAAFDHIPQARRAAFYQRLLTRLNAPDFAYALMAMIALRKPSDNAVLTVLQTIMVDFDVNTQLITYSKLSSLVSDVYSPTAQAAEALLGVSHSANAHIENKAAIVLLRLARVLLENQPLQRKMSALRKTDDTASQEVMDIIKISLSQTVKMVQDHQAERKPIFELAKECLDALLKLLRLSDFCILVPEILKDLDKVGSKDLQPHALRLLAEQVGKSARKDITAQASATGLLPWLSSKLLESTDPTLKHAVVACLDRIVEVYGRKNVDSCLGASFTMASDQALGSNDPRLQVMSLLSLASMLDILKEVAIPLLPELVPKVLNILQSSIEAETSEVHNASFAVLSAAISHLSFVLPKEHIEQILRLSAESSNAEIEPSCAESRVEACTLLARHVDLEVVVACLSKAWTSAVENGSKAISEMLQVFSIAIERAPKARVIDLAESISSFLLQVLNLRRIQFTTRDEDSYTDAEVERVETEIADVALKIIYKLNDKAFRPVFESWIDWALQRHDLSSSSDTIQSRAKILRQTSLFKLLTIFFDNLKNIVTSYTSYLLDPANTILSEFSTYATLPTKSFSLDTDSLILYKSLLDLLTTISHHDADSFLASPSHFTPLSTNLINQLHLATHRSLRPLIQSHIIPAIVSLATSTIDTPSHHHSLNKLLCALRRSESPHVRLSSIQTHLALTNDEMIGDEWTNNVAGSNAGSEGGMGETMVYVNEMLEDDDEDVERSVREWVRLVRERVGEDVFET